MEKAGSRREVPKVKLLKVDLKTNAVITEVFALLFSSWRYGEGMFGY